jgi:two-component system nitrogen regulation sensor histidine kinase GlnL
MIEGDEDLLHRAIYNLLLNAVQASPPNGEVRVEGGELATHQLPEGRPEFERGAFGILVSDRGAGVPPQIRDRLFDPFVTTKQSGTGLGLALVAKIIGDHGGIIECDSRPRFTVFRALMPMSESEAVQGGQA